VKLAPKGLRDRKDQRDPKVIRGQTVHRGLLVLMVLQGPRETPVPMAWMERRELKDRRGTRGFTAGT